jgi:hypothetical protein
LLKYFYFQFTRISFFGAASAKWHAQVSWCAALAGFVVDSAFFKAPADQNEMII